MVTMKDAAAAAAAAATVHTESCNGGRNSNSSSNNNNNNKFVKALSVSGRKKKAVLLILLLSSVSLLMGLQQIKGTVIFQQLMPTTTTTTSSVTNIFNNSNNNSNASNFERTRPLSNLPLLSSSSLSSSSSLLNVSTINLSSSSSISENTAMFRHSKDDNKSSNNNNNNNNNVLFPRVHNHHHHRYYTSQDIARFVVREWRQSRFHVLLFDGQKFHLYRLTKDPREALTCYCREHLIELLIDGLLLTRQRPSSQRFGLTNITTTNATTANTNNANTTTPPSSSSWQLLLDVTRDNILYPCMEINNKDGGNGNGGNGDYYCSNENYPPVVTLASIPTTSHVMAPFLYQFPTTFYNDCLYHHLRHKNDFPLPQQQQMQTSPSSSSSQDACALRTIVNQFINNHHNSNNMTTQNMWESLIPQVYWRGTSLAFVSGDYTDCLDLLPRYRTNINLTVAQIADWLLLPSQPPLIPRCRAIAMSLQAEAEWLQLHSTTYAASSNTTTTTTTMNGNEINNKVTTINNTHHHKRRLSHPWIDIKYGGRDKYHNKYTRRGYDFFLGKFTSPQDMARYKYQIDLGGNGGTTWKGTITKLAMPGLLFHHETPTKDWFHDEIQPWVHYVPIHTNLSNLYDMYAWAESHPNEAKQIAQQGQDYARYHISDAHFQATFQRLYVDQLGAIADAYQPAPGETLESILQVYNETGLFATRMATCTATSCQFFIRDWKRGW